MRPPPSSRYAPQRSHFPGTFQFLHDAFKTSLKGIYVFVPTVLPKICWLIRRPSILMHVCMSGSGTPGKFKECCWLISSQRSSSRVCSIDFQDHFQNIMNFFLLIFSAFFSILFFLIAFFLQICYHTHVCFFLIDRSALPN